jgi:hypothetical protein
MTRRLLPPEEWPRLAGDPQLGEVWQLFDPLSTSVLVVEDDTGQIVGSWSFTHVLHAEGVHIHPAYRKSGVVARHLWRGMRELAAEQGAAAVWTGAGTPEVRDLLVAHGAQKFPVDSFVLPLGKGQEN